MKTYEILTRVEVHDEAALITAAREQWERTDGTDSEINTIEAALDELSHLGDPWRPDGERGPIDCGVEILIRIVTRAAGDCGVEVLNRKVRETAEKVSQEDIQAPGRCERCGIEAQRRYSVSTPNDLEYLCAACFQQHVEARNRVKLDASG